MSIHKKQAEEFVTQQQAIAYETYKAEKRAARKAGRPHSVTTSIIEDRLGLPRHSLHWFVGNRNRRIRQQKHAQ